MGYEYYTEQWAKDLGVDKDPDPIWAIVEKLVNSAKNYDTAVAMMFELSWHDADQNKWLRRCSDELAKLPSVYPGTFFDRMFLAEWVTYYTTEVEAEFKKAVPQ